MHCESADVVVEDVLYFILFRVTRLVHAFGSEQQAG